MAFQQDHDHKPKYIMQELSLKHVSLHERQNILSLVVISKTILF